MRKPGPTIAVMFGMPSSHLAHDSDDEDQLDREGHDDDQANDLAADAIDTIADALRHEGPPAIRRVRIFARALENMAEATMNKDHAGLSDACADAYEALSKLIID